ncbi:hypothetical protein GMRT_23281 [Giardia muris]|uniref:Uncharacterized protein n=1 Tax=Giardia muris TaxID=5742 RepID=A0A4Z1SPD1_GIAMU|nr:hypothetical protein GMRT_23281 [Giardia muris]|eukprot:TNJ27682.1 hypothetical protein GMRT_23281 [Giardia muris]
MEKLFRIANDVLGTSLTVGTECIKAPIELPNFASANLTMKSDPAGSVTVILEKGNMCISGTFPLDGEVETRMRTFLGAWGAIGMVSNPLGPSIKAIPTCNIATSILDDQKSLPYRPDVRGKNGLEDTRARRPTGPLGLEQDGNLIGLDHPMFKKDEEQRQGGGDPFNPFDLDGNGTRRPRHLPPGARWEPVRPKIRDPLQPSGNLPYI